MSRLLSILLAVLIIGPAAYANLKVAALHPFIGDLARQVGGSHIDVLDLLPIGNTPHGFQPTPGDFVQLAKSDLVLASGKNIEPYLDKVRDNIPEGTPLVEVGRRIPSLLIDAESEIFVCCPLHSRGAIDPHWWHSIKNMQRAAKIVRQALCDADPANKDAYRKQERAYVQQLKELDQWARDELKRIPDQDRYLVTAHAAFGYFCKEFGFKAIPVQGLNQEKDPAPGHLADTIKLLRQKHIRAVFPENTANPKVLSAMVDAADVLIGGRLFADGPSREHPTYVEAVKYNVQTIVEALATAESNQP